MENIDVVIQLLKNIQTEPLSNTIPQVLPIALQCKDYKGFCILSQFITPIATNTKTNKLQTDELMRILLLHGVPTDMIVQIITDSKEEYIELKTVAEDQISSHSLKEIEDWIPEANGILSSAPNVPQESYNGLYQRVAQMRKLYEVMRSYVVSKLTYYQQALTLMNSNGSQKVQTDKMNKIFNVNKVFIVHGHNGEIKEALARMLEKQRITPVILHEQANQGDTIIEKFERNSDVGCAVCLFTADDIGKAKNEINEKSRARQNVVFEAGYFIGKIGRERVIFIADKGVEMPSDLQGILYTDSNNWRFQVLKELKSLGYNVDYSVMGD